MDNATETQPITTQGTKFCKHCGSKIPADSVLCTACGRQKNKWVALLLCLFLGVVGGHKFYEGKVGMGVLYLFTGGLFGIGALIDFIVILTKPNPYYV